MPPRTATATVQAQVEVARIQADLLRELFGNLFRPITIPDTWLLVNEASVEHLARLIDDNQAFDRMPILADALEEAGCDSEALLRHCRRPGGQIRPHAEAGASIKYVGTAGWPGGHGAALRPGSRVAAAQADRLVYQSILFPSPRYGA